MTEFHADDYGLFPAQARRILQCYEEGALNGVSIMPNSPCLEQCLEMLPEKGLALTVHLNLMEGRSAAPGEELPHLVDGDGVPSMHASIQRPDPMYDDKATNFIRTPTVVLPADRPVNEYQLSEVTLTLYPSAYNDFFSDIA